MRQSSEFSMEQDDSTMVDDILKELNRAPPTQVNTLPNIPPPSLNGQELTRGNVEQTAPPETLRLPLVHPDASILHGGMQPVQVQVAPPVIQPGWISKIVYKLKMPLILALCIFVIFNPLTRRILNRYTPAIFNSTSHWRQQLSVMILSVLTGIGFTGLRYIL